MHIIQSGIRYCHYIYISRSIHNFCIICKCTTELVCKRSGIGDTPANYLNYFVIRFYHQPSKYGSYVSRSNNYYSHNCIFDEMKLKEKIAIGYIRAKFKMITAISKRLAAEK